MPSLKVDSNKNVLDSEDTFTHFYHDYTSQTTLSSSKNANDRLYLCRKFVVSVLSILMTVFATFIITWGFESATDYNLNNTYNADKLYFVVIWCYIIAQFIVISSILSIFMNQFYKYSLKMIVFISFIINIILNGAIVTYLSYQYNVNNNTIFRLKFICQFNVVADSYFEHYCKLIFSMYQLYFAIFSFSICLLSQIIIHHLLYIHCYKNDNYLKRHKNIIKYNSNNIEQEMVLLNDYNYSNHEVEHSKVFNSIPQRTHMHVHKSKHVQERFFWLYIIFTLLFLLFNICVYCIFYIVYNIPTFGYYFYSILGTTATFKQMLKYVARKIDVLTVHYKRNEMDNNNDNNNNCNDTSIVKWYDFVSFEILMECYIDMMYFYLYYYLFIKELSEIDFDNISLFVKIETLHILSEIWQSIIRFSSIYFDFSDKIYLKFVDYTQSKQYHFINNMLIKLFKDESNLIEWQTRHSIDMSIKVLSLINSFLIITIDVFVQGKSTFGISNEEDFYQAIFYFSLSFSIDIMYFALIFGINYYKSRQNVWKPFLLMYQSNSKTILYLFAVSQLWRMSFNN